MFLGLLWSVGRFLASAGASQTRLWVRNLTKCTPLVSKDDLVACLYACLYVSSSVCPACVCLKVCMSVSTRMILAHTYLYCFGWSVADTFLKENFSEMHAFGLQGRSVCMSVCLAVCQFFCLPCICLLESLHVCQHVCDPSVHMFVLSLGSMDCLSTFTFSFALRSRLCLH